MRAHVLTDPRLAKLAGRFVRLDVDTEKPRNAAFVERFPIDAWPTLLVVDPSTEEVVLRWTGTATAEQIERLALDAERAVRAGRASRADAALARADRLLGERRHAEAAAAYGDALAAGGKAWPARERAAEALVQALAFGGDAPACAARAREVLAWLVPGAASARVAATGLGCARELPQGDGRAAALRDLERRAARALEASGVLADDRSWLYDELSQARALRGDEAGARELARRWLVFLEREAARARTPLARAAFDGQRVSAALRAGAPERVLRALLASEKDLPDDYVPPTNLGVVYLALGRPADALAAAERALARAEGPRRVRVLVLAAEAAEALGDRAAARSTLDRALAESASLPEASRPRGWTARAERMRASLGGE